MNTTEGRVVDKLPPVRPPVIDKRKEALAEAYQKAAIDEQTQRVATNAAIQALRAAERKLRDAAHNYAEYDQYKLKFG